MNKINLLKAPLAFTILLGAAKLYAATPFVTGKYNIDSAHTRVSFVVPHFVVSQVEGRFNDVKGTFNLAEPFESSKAEVTIDIKSIDTGVAKRDEDLRSKS